MPRYHGAGNTHLPHSETLQKASHPPLARGESLNDLFRTRSSR